MPRSIRRPSGRLRSTTLPAIGLVAVLGLATSACSDDDPAADPAGDAMMTAVITVVDAFPAGARAVETAPSEETFPLFIREATVEGSTLQLLVGAGEAPCMWLVGGEVVSESDTDVVVTVLAGGDAEAEGCDSQEVSDQVVTLELSEPLGDRSLLDATRMVEGGPAD